MNDAAACPTFSETALVGFMEDEPEPPRFALDPILPRRVVTLLGGHGGSGKSFLALTLLAHGACGIPFARFCPDGMVRGVYCTFEDSGICARDRLRHIVNAHGLDAGLIEQNLRILDGSEIGKPLAFAVNEFGNRSLRANYLLADLADAVATGVDLVVIDHASDAYDGDENSRREVRAFIRMLTDLARASNAAVMLLAHIDKMAARGGSKGQSYSGSTAWHNGSRSRLALVENEADDTLTLHHEKANLTARSDAITLRRNEHGVPLIVSFDTAGAAGREQDVKAAFSLMQAAAASNVRVVRATTGSATAWHTTKHLPEAAHFADKATGPRRLASALETLYRQGLIQQTECMTEGRKRRQVWALTMPAAALGPASLFGVENAAGQVRAASPHTPLMGAGARAEETTRPAPICANVALAQIGAEERMPNPETPKQADANYRCASEGEP